MGERQIWQAKVPPQCRPSRCSSLAGSQAVAVPQAKGELQFARPWNVPPMGVSPSTCPTRACVWASMAPPCREELVLLTSLCTSPSSYATVKSLRPVDRVPLKWRG